MVAITLRADLSRGLTNAEIDANFSNLKTAVEAAALSAAWANLTGKPTTLSGYGITDAQSALVSGTSIKTVNGQSVLGSGNIQIDGGVTSFNTRTGAITLGSSDVTTALGFTPYNSTNPSGFISGITSAMVTTALGFTPYNSSNPSGYLTGITSAQVTTALGFTPYNSTNPSGYISGINSSMVTSALGFTPYNNTNPSGFISGITSAMVTTALGFTPLSNATSYLPLAGGTLSGAMRVYLNGGAAVTPHIYWANAANNRAYNWQLDESDNAALWGYGSAGAWTKLTTISSTGAFNTIGAITQNGSQVLHASNYSNYAPTFLGNYERSANARIYGATTGAMGLVGVDSANAFRFQVYGDGTNYGFLSSVWGSWSLKGDASGNWTATANITAYSDESLKTDWAPLATDFVEQLALIKSGTYTRIDINERQAGSSAQGWRKLLPEVVQEGSDGILALAYGNAALVSAVELAKRVVKLEERLNKLGA
jgi:hypothetical protein